MRIAADASFMRWRPTGIGRYMQGLLTALERTLTPDDQMTVYYNALPGKKLFGDRVRERALRVPGATAYNQVGIAGALAFGGADVYLGCANIIPVLARRPRVLVMHDCLPFAYPEAKPAAVTRYYQRWMRRSAAHAARVIAVSEWAASECARYLGVSREAIDVVHEGVDPRFRPASPAAPVAAPPTVQGRRLEDPFVLQVGAFDPHKGSETLRQAVEMLRARGHALTLVRTGPELGAAAPPWALDAGVVDDAQLLALYQAATVVGVPSRYEGFGLPVLEAMACGAPVVASRAGGLPEAGGDAAVYAEPGDAAGFASAIETLLTSGDERAARARAGLAQAARFDWNDSAAIVYRVLAEVAGHQPVGGVDVRTSR